MRIGTWNPDGRWSSRHADLLEAQVCDIWLLTEVPIQASLTGYDVHLGGPEHAGSRSGRRAILDALASLDLQVPTRDLPSAGGGLSIDHLAVSSSATIAFTDRIVAVHDGARLSDHDAYVVELAG